MARELLTARAGTALVGQAGNFGVVGGVATTGTAESDLSWVEIDTGLEEVKGFAATPYAARAVAGGDDGGAKEDHIVELSYQIQTDKSKVKVWSTSMPNDAVPADLPSLTFSWIAVGILASADAHPVVVNDSDASAA